MPLVAFFKGVNVCGHKTFRPSMLAQELSDFDVVNIGAAGTFVIRKPVSRERLKKEILNRLPFKAAVIFCYGREILQLGSENPFEHQPSRPNIVRFVSVAEKRPHSLPALPITLPSGGRWCLRVIALQGQFVLGLYRREMKAIGFLSQLEKVIGVPLTTRNWNTLCSIA